MMPILRRTLLASALLAATLVTVTQAAERSQIDKKYTWDLGALFPSDAAWSAAKADIAARIPSLAAYKGKLGTSAADLLAGLEAYMDLQLKLERLGTYASQRADEDARVSATGEMREEAQQLGVTMRASYRLYVRRDISAVS
jgi:oligoendopeptidase F